VTKLISTPTAAPVIARMPRHIHSDTDDADDDTVVHARVHARVHAVIHVAVHAVILVVSFPSEVRRTSIQIPTHIP
jgi:hypothetical protein